MNYSEDLIKTINYALEDLIAEYLKGAIMFDEKRNKNIIVNIWF